MVGKVAYLRPRAPSSDVASDAVGLPQPPATTGFRSSFASDLSRLLGAIYQGPLETPPWHSAMQLLKERLQAAHVVLILRAPTAERGGLFIVPGAEDLAARNSYEKRYFAVDPFVGLKEGEVVTPEELLGEKWLTSSIYREYLRPLDIRYMLGADFRTADGIECRLRATRCHQAKPFSEDDKALYRLVLPHLQQSVQMHTRIDSLECERQVFAGAVNRLLLGVISLDQDGEIVEMNSEATRILSERDGIAHTGNALCLDSQQEKRELQRLISQAIAGKPVAASPGLIDAMAVTRPSGRCRLALMVKPIQSREWSEGRRRPVAALFIRDPAAQSVAPSRELVRRLFGLTRGESRLAIFLSEGYTLDETAELMNIRRNTARTHLRSIFAKTGVTRQTMLVRMMLRSVMALG